MNKKQKNMLARILAALVCLIIVKIAEKSIPFWWLQLALYMIPYLIVGWDVLRKAVKGIKNHQVFDECFLMTVATLGAIAVGIYDGIHTGSGDYLEAVAVMLLYQVGELFQSIAVGRSRRNISELMDIRPDYANLEEDGEVSRVDPDEVEVDSVIVVNPGEKIPLDGVVLSGESMLNTAALTGESVPRAARPGDTVLSGCINENGVLRIRTTAEFDESTASKILDLVENAAARKSRSENFISQFARWYTPLVCYAALALAVLPPVFLAITGREVQLFTWIYRACTFLVISCPCAVVISIPLTFFAGLGGASNQGILIKGSNYLETLSQVRTVAFDKTGTVTKGNFAVTEVHPAEGFTKEDLLEMAAYAESHSSHPISRSLRQAFGQETELAAVTDVQEISGHGVTAVYKGRNVAAGNEKLMDRLGIVIPEVPETTGTKVFVAAEGKYAGCVVIADEIKPEAKAAMDGLKRAGVRQAVMLTGDASAVAESVAKTVGIDTVRAELLPAQKVEAVEELIRQAAGGAEEDPKRPKVAFVGDGINDAPVLSRADVGIAMGALGSDAAIEAADVVLMDDDPRKIGKAIRISRKCLRIVWQNIIFALGVKGICLVLGAIGAAGMWLAIFADVGVMVLCVLNAVRALFLKNV